MSYLSHTRLHFAGGFRADVSTVNNTRANFDLGQSQVRPLFQPQGTNAWRLRNCRIRGAAAGGEVALTAAADPIVGLALREGVDGVSAKLVDLDPNQQMVSTIFGLGVRILDGGGRLLLAGRMTPIAFQDLWGGRGGGAGDMGMGAYYQSVLEDLEWGDVAASPCLTTLRGASPDTLSIKFNVDRYSTGNLADPALDTNRGYGRIVGTIGPHQAGEPRHHVRGRHIGTGGTEAPCVLDAAGEKLLADFGNLLPLDPQNASIFANLGDVRLKAGALDLGALRGYTGPDWYEETAGIQAFPPDRALTAAERAQVAATPLSVVVVEPAGATPVAKEAADGLYVRPDTFVYRLEPGATAEVPVVATRFGAPVAGQTVTTRIGVQTLQGPPPVATPANALSATGAVTDASGRTVVGLQASDPGRPRVYVDGQVYAVEVRLAGAAASGSDFSARCVISVLIFSRTPMPAEVRWNRDVAPILRQYARLYPRPHGPDNYVPLDGRPALHPVVSLEDPVAVAAFAPRILQALALPFDHPGHMPVVRDLSAGRRAILVRWLQAALAGTADIPKPTAALAAVDFEAPETVQQVASLGGKTEALARELTRDAPETKP